MGSTLNYLLKHPSLFQYAVGITYPQFTDILPKFSQALRQAEYKRAYSFKRVREVGGGRKATLKSDLEKLFFILLYYKLYPTFRFAQAMFEFDKRNIQLWVRFLSPVLFSALGYELSLPIRKRRVNRYEAWIEECPDLKQFLVDCTERSVQRPKDHKLQEKYYSGKKKHHSVKNQLLVSPRNTRILAISNTHPGTSHDKKLFEQDPLILKAPEESVAMADSGYQGADGIQPFLKVVIPKRKPPGQELTEAEKANNQAISRVRVRVEHPISYLKHFNILSQKYRGRVENTDQLDLPIKTIACIYNFTRPPS